jgi:hypothetical protein
VLLEVQKDLGHKTNKMKNNTLVSVRSNCNFSLNYETGKLHPQTEIILITTAPKYVLDKKQTGFTKEMDITEYRFLSGLDGVNKLIGELQLVVKNMNAFEQTASAFNVIIESSKNEQGVSDK